MENETSKRLENIEAGMSSENSGNDSRAGVRKDKFKERLKKFGIYAALIAGVMSIPTCYLTKDFLTKRQNYPERNVLFRSSNVTYLAGNEDQKKTARADKESVTLFYEGGGVESKIGTFLFKTSREIRGDIEYYNMDGSSNIRNASSTQKYEKFQAGLRFEGGTNYREEFAELVLGKGSKSPQNYVVYKFAPERGLSELDVDVLDHVDGRRELINRLKEKRTFPLGLFWGKFLYRAGTRLEDYNETKQNEELARKFLEEIKRLDSSESVKPSDREKLVKKLKEIESQMQVVPLYTTFEDGYLKILPQESTNYLGYSPEFFERVKHFWTGFGRKDHQRLRVTNQWDLFPGRIPFLSDINLGSGENKIYPFDKYNNGGYTIEDRYGELAKITINDFILYYGQDIVYSYYLDINGDGKIKDSDELIGKVLCRTTHDQRMALERINRHEPRESDTTVTINYSFMAPDQDKEKGLNYFDLCAYIESMIPDQVHRGYGKHSLLGLINEQRSDIMLYRFKNVENLSRALTQESTLVAKYDIIHVLNAARRPYARELARTYGIEDHFEGQYQSSSLLKEKLEIGPLPGTVLTFGLIYGAYKFMKRRRNKTENLLNVTERLKIIKGEQKWISKS